MYKLDKVDRDNYDKGHNSKSAERTKMFLYFVGNYDKSTYYEYVL